MALNVTRGRMRPPRGILYGPPKIGKSTFGSHTPNPVFIAAEAGADNLSVDQVAASSWDELRQAVIDIAAEKHDYKTVVLDTLTAAEELCEAYVLAKHFGGKREKFDAYGKGMLATAEELGNLRPLLDKCRARGMMVWLLAHHAMVRVADPDGNEYHKHSASLGKHAWPKFKNWADVILRADYEYAVVENNGRKHAVGDDKRILIASGSIIEDAGCRVGYELPARMDLGYKHVADGLRAAAERMKNA
jgi:hypothetical protein